MTFLIESLVFVSSGMLIPCIAVLFLLLGQALLMLVSTLRGYRKDLLGLDALFAWVRTDSPEVQPPLEAIAGAFGDCFNAMRAAKEQAMALYLMAEYEVQCEQRLAAASRLARLGPMMGLLGTLIPMGPALDGLANGDVAQLAGQMQIAFTTTVIGLLIGAIGLVIAQRERHIINRQLASLDYLCDVRDGSTRR